MCGNIKILSVEVNGQIFDLRQTKQEPIMEKEPEKICRHCKISKPISSFYNDKASSDLHSSWCSTCARKAEKKSRIEKRKLLSEQSNKPDIGIVDGTLPDAIPVTLSSSVINDQEKRKKFFNRI